MRNDPPVPGGRSGSIALDVAAGASFAGRLAERVRRIENGVLALLERLLFTRRTDAPKRVGLWRVGMIGDTLAALPALEAVRAAHPHAELVLFTSPGPDAAPGARELLDGSPAVDRIVRWSNEELARLGRRGFVRRLAANRVDRLYVLPQDRTTPRLELRTLLALRLAGFGDVRGARLSTAHFLPRPLARAHDRAVQWPSVSTRLLAHVRAHGAVGGQLGAGPSHAADDATQRALVVDAARRARAGELVAAAAPGDGPLLCLAPGAKLEHKRWPAERFGELARRWIDRGGRALVLGGPGDAELAARVRAAAQRAVPDLCGRTDLLESAAILMDADALVSNDTGTMHLGAAVGTPLVALFSGWDRRGAWDPVVRDPERPPIVLRRAAPCSPCLAPSCANRSAQNVPACLAIDVDAVEAALDERARRLPGPAAATERTAA